MIPIVYDKPFLDFPDLIRHLREDYNLEIADDDFATHALKTYSYYDLVNGYKDIFMRAGKYTNGTTIEQLCNFYLFDNGFKNVLFTRIMLIENYFKMLLSYQISKDFGVDENIYLDTRNYNYAVRFINVPDLLNNILSLCQNNQAPMPTRHYVLNHNHRPAWIVFKNISFGNSINLFRALRPAQKNPIVNELIPDNSLKLKDKIEFITSGLNLIRKCRNTIAHNYKFITFSGNNYDELKLSHINALLPSPFTTTNSSFGSIKRGGIYAVFLFIYALLNDSVLKRNFCLSICKQIATQPDTYIKYAKATGLPIDFSDRLSDVINGNSANNIKIVRRISLRQKLALLNN